MGGVFLVKLVARPDPRLVEVPLEIEAELPRDFDGTVLLAASGLPRKVKLKAPKDALKLSTAYRTDQLLADMVRSALRGSPEDAARVQEATLGFVRGVRERRLDGAMLLVRSDGSGGRIELSEPAPEPPAGKATPARKAAKAGKAAPVKAGTAGQAEDPGGQAEDPGEQGDPGGQADRGAQTDAAARGTMKDRLAVLERRIAQLESWRTRRSAEESPASALSGSEGPAGAQRGRGALRRGTAVDAFSDGLRKELSGRASQLLGAADRAAAACDHATRLAAEAVRDLGAPPLGSEGDALNRLAREAAARQRALQRFLDEVDLYAPAELLMAERLLLRLSTAGPEGATDPDPAGPLSALGEQLLRDGRGSELLAVWVTHAAPLCRWKLIEPPVGEPLNPALHETKEGAAAGARIARLLVPGVLRPDGSVLVRARVSLDGDSADAEAAELAKDLLDSPQAVPASAAASVPTSTSPSASASGLPSATASLEMSDEDVEEVEELGAPAGTGAGASPTQQESSTKSSGKPWED
jgi:hypothetical protein